jgi:uncharacterized membrane protein
MQQTESEYLTTLKERLAEYVSREDLDDILADYAEHFSIGKSEGRSEEDLCRALGSPEDVAKEIRATYLVKKAEQARTPGNIWHAVMATLGLGLFNLVVVLVPFVLLVVLLTIILVVGVILVIAGPMLLLAAVMSMLGIPLPVSLQHSPFFSIVYAVVLTVTGVVLVIVDINLARFFYRFAIRYMKWNIHVIRGGEAQEPGVPVQKITTIQRNGATGLDLQMLFGVAEITLGEGTDDQTLVKLTSGSDSTPAPFDYYTSQSGGIEKVRIRGRHSFGSLCSDESMHGWGSWCSDKSMYIWDIRLNRQVPVSLDIRNKAGRTRLDLGDLNLSGLRIRNGAGETSVDLTGYRGGNFDATIKNGVGSLIIRVPKESSMRIQIHRGLGDMDVRGLLVQGDTYVTPSPVAGAPQITCRIRQGIGSIYLEAV